MALRKGAAWPGLTGLVVLTLSLLIAAACAGPPQARKDLPPEETIVRSATAEQPVKSVKEDSTASVHDEKSSPAPKPEPTPKISRRVINNDPTQLIGLAPDAINRLLGPPSLLRTEPPAQVWQYKIADCVLIFFSIPAKQNRKMQPLSISRFAKARQHQEARAPVLPPSSKAE